MREIKFRGIRLEYNPDWHKSIYRFGNLLNNNSIGEVGYDLLHYEYAKVKPETIGQFIGIKDKNGVEIYEGDYLLDRSPIDEEDLNLGYNESLMPVVWCEKQLMWCIDASFKKDGSFLTSLVDYFGKHLEVRGNIHENPLK